MYNISSRREEKKNFFFLLNYLFLLFPMVRVYSFVSPFFCSFFLFFFFVCMSVWRLMTQATNLDSQEFCLIQQPLEVHKNQTYHAEICVVNFSTNVYFKESAKKKEKEMNKQFSYQLHNGFGCDNFFFHSILYFVTNTCACSISICVHTFNQTYHWNTNKQHQITILIWQHENMKWLYCYLMSMHMRSA